MLKENMTTISFAEMSDQQLLAAVAQAAGCERRATVELIALLGEVDARRLYLAEGCPSLFVYCTRVLHLSKHEAYLRIEVARVARRFPVVLERLADGTLTLTTIATLGPHLTDANVDVLLSAATHKTRREVEHQVACLAPKPDAKTMIRRLPTPAAPSLIAPTEPPLAVAASAESPRASDAPAALATPARPVPRAQSTPLSADRYLLRVTLSADAHAKLRRAQDLMRHQMQNGDPAAVLERALSLLVDHLEKQKAPRTKKPGVRAAAGASRYIPADVKRDVWARDEGRCAFVGRYGRCNETGMLEFHHIEPFARGGSATAANLALRCRAHNQYADS